jgi:hypothetical protein
MGEIYIYVGAVEVFHKDIIYTRLAGQLHNK